MKKLGIFLSLIAALCLFATTSCEHGEVSYLNASGLKYPGNTMTVVLGLTDADTLISRTSAGFSPSIEFVYKARIKNRAPWISAPFWGATVEGARPFTITVAEVKTTGEQADAEKLLEELVIYGEGVVKLPFDTKVPVGEYLLSYNVSNIAGTERVDDCFTVIVTDQK